MAAERAARPLPLEALYAYRDPYIAEPQYYEPLIGEAPVPGGRYAVAPFDVDGRAGCLVALVERDGFGDRELGLLGGLAQQAKLGSANPPSQDGHVGAIGYTA